MHTEDFCAIVEPGITREGLNQVRIFENNTLINLKNKDNSRFYSHFLTEEA